MPWAEPNGEPITLVLKCMAPISRGEDRNSWPSQKISHWAPQKKQKKTFQTSSPHSGPVLSYRPPDKHLISVSSFLATNITKLSFKPESRNIAAISRASGWISSLSFQTLPLISSDLDGWWREKTEFMTDQHSSDKRHGVTWNSPVWRSLRSQREWKWSSGASTWISADRWCN